MLMKSLQKTAAGSKTKRNVLLCAVLLIILFFAFKPSGGVDRKETFNFRIAYVVVNSKWLAPQHYVQRVRAIQSTWATEIRPGKDTITYAVDAKYVPNLASPGADILELPQDMENHAMLYTLGRMLANANGNANAQASDGSVDAKTEASGAGPFDWVFIAADASYVIPQNVEVLIDRLPRDSNLTAAYLGVPLLLPIEGPYSFPKLQHLIFNSASGVLMNRLAASMLLDAIKDRGCVVKCEGCPEDILVAFCLRTIGVLAQDTRDAARRDRFHVFQPLTLVDEKRQGFTDYSYNNSEWLTIYSRWKNEIKPLEPSPATLNFHYVDEDEMYAIHHALYHVRPIARSSLLPSALHTDAFLRGALIDNDDKNYQSKFGGFIRPENEKIRKFLLTTLQISASPSDPVRSIETSNS